MSSAPVFRFAPSPNGELHLGHALSALTGYEMARRLGGRFLVRIEDIDTERSREEHVRQILDDLNWLGLQWEEPVLRQSARFPVYAEAARGLLERGLLYPCFATRSEIERAAAADPIGTDPDGAPRYPGLCRGLGAAEIARRTASGEPFCLRLDMARAIAEADRLTGGVPLVFTEIDEAGVPSRVVAADPARWGDAVLVRKDTPASYHLAVVIDDAAQAVTHVTRGQDLFAATGLHRLLQVLLALPAPVYLHHRLICDAEGRKLAKSLRDTSLRALRAEGLSPADVRRLAGLRRCEVATGEGN